MYVTKVALTGYRCFKSEKVKFAVPGQSSSRLSNVTVLLGNNGSGKSSVLSGIAIAILGVMLRDSGGVPLRNQVRRDSSGGGLEAELEVDLLLEPAEAPKSMNTLSLKTPLVRIPTSNREKFGLVAAPPEVASVLDQEESADLFLVGYGTGRRSEPGSDYDPSRRQQRYIERFQRVAGLFLDEFSLVPLAAWLPEATKKRSDEVQEIFTSTLGPGLRLTNRMEHGELVVEDGEVELSVAALSDGYRSFLSWMGDLLYRLHRAAPQGDLKSLKGVVLVDEIDLHLHPEWQRRVVPLVARALPNLQFVLSTHSPLVVGSLEASNLRVLEKVGSRAHVKPAAESPYGLSGDQVLLSAYFGLRELRDSDFERELEQVRQRAVGGDLEAADELTRMLTLGARAREES